MYEGSLTTFQRRLLALLGSVRPRWRLTRGGALAGYHAGHRETRDLDLFWRSMERFDEVVADVERVLNEAGLRVQRVQTAPTFARRRVSDGDASNKLCTLLSRSELRDLIDARWLTEHGGDLDRAVREAQDKDGGFSAAVLAWVLQGSNLDAMGRAAGVEPEALEDLRRWRVGLIKRLIALSPP
jgi:hypothetical protein